MAELTDEKAAPIFLRPSTDLRAALDAYVDAQNDVPSHSKRSRNAIVCELLARALKDATRDRKGAK